MDDEEYYVNNLSFREIRPNDPSEKRPVVTNFGKQVPRFPVDLRREMDLEQDECIVENALPEKKIKGAVVMDTSKTERFP